MTRAVAIGDAGELAGYALAGVEVIACSTPEEARRAARTLAADVALVILSARVAATSADVERNRGVVWCVVPS